MRSIWIVSVVGALAAPLTAHADFHLWEFTELYSTPDGTVQFIEMYNHSDGEHVLGGKRMGVRSGGNENLFTFPANLPSTDTSDHHILLATSVFTALTGVTPDYTLPSGFLFSGGGVLDFADLLISWNYGPQPGGGGSLDFDTGLFGPATPTNFAGQVGVVPEPVLLAPAALAALGVRRRKRRK